MSSNASHRPNHQHSNVMSHIFVIPKLVVGLPGPKKIGPTQTQSDPFTLLMISSPALIEVTWILSKQIIWDTRLWYIKTVFNLHIVEQSRKSHHTYSQFCFFSQCNTYSALLNCLLWQFDHLLNSHQAATSLFTAETARGPKCGFATHHAAYNHYWDTWISIFGNEAIKVSKKKQVMELRFVRFVFCLYRYIFFSPKNPSNTWCDSFKYLCCLFCVHFFEICCAKGATPSATCMFCSRCLW